MNKDNKSTPQVSFAEKRAKKKSSHIYNKKLKNMIELFSNIKLREVTEEEKNSIRFFLELPEFEETRRYTKRDNNGPVKDSLKY